jgi:glycosyltransferase involved in cell wall biosynthesis
LLAARRLVHDIWPEVHRRVPHARLVLGGADAPREVRRWHGAGGVRVESPVGDMSSFLRRALVAAAPVDLGTGTPNKIYEAFEAGAAVVASGAVAARAELDGVRPPVSVAEDDAAFAASLVRYLENPHEAVDDGQAGRAFVEDHADRAQAVSRFAEIFRRAAHRAGAGNAAS